MLIEPVGGFTFQAIVHADTIPVALLALFTAQCSATCQEQRNDKKSEDLQGIPHPVDFSFPIGMFSPFSFPQKPEHPHILMHEDAGFTMQASYDILLIEIHKSA
jgi:hypothetical protein